MSRLARRPGRTDPTTRRSGYPRQQWAADAAQKLAEGIWLMLDRKAGRNNVDVDLALPAAVQAFRQMIFSVGNIPGGQPHEAVIRMILEARMPVNRALTKVGC